MLTQRKTSRIVFTGTSGVCKHEALGKLRARVLSGLPEDLRDGHVAIYSVDDEITKLVSGPVHVFLENASIKEKHRIWKEAFRAILERLEVENPRHCFLALHALYRYNSEYQSFVDWDLLARFQPTVFITLIDDIYDILERVNHGRKVDPREEVFFTPAEVLAWRSAEILFARTLAENLYVNPDTHNISSDILQSLAVQFPTVRSIIHRPRRHFLLSVKQSVESLFRLLFRRDIPVVYASFSISEPRKLEFRNQRDETDQWRRVLHDEFCVVDPLCIDELRFVPGTMELESRWPAGLENPLVEPPVVTRDPIEGLSPSERRRLSQKISDQIETRDFSLVGQSDYVVVYRPFWAHFQKRDISEGVEREMVMANTLGKPTFVLHTDEDEHWYDKAVRNSLGLERKPFSIFEQLRRQTRSTPDSVIKLIKAYASRREAPSSGWFLD